MKTKNFKKKLDLNKKTIVNLNNELLGKVKGGESAACPAVIINDPGLETEPTCQTCETCVTCVTCATCPAISCKFGCVTGIER